MVAEGCFRCLGMEWHGFESEVVVVGLFAERCWLLDARRGEGGEHVVLAR